MIGLINPRHHFYKKKGALRPDGKFLLVYKRFTYNLKDLIVE